MVEEHKEENGELETEREEKRQTEGQEPVKREEEEDEDRQRDGETDRQREEEEEERERERKAALLLFQTMTGNVAKDSHIVQQDTVQYIGSITDTACCQGWVGDVDRSGSRRAEPNNKRSWQVTE